MHNLTFPLLLCVFSGRCQCVYRLSEAGAGSGDTASSVPQTTLQAVLLATSAPADFPDGMVVATVAIAANLNRIVPRRSTNNIP